MKELNFSTQMDAARRGIVTSQMKAVAEHENISVQKLMELVPKGEVAIPANKNHKCLSPYGDTRKFRTKLTRECEESTHEKEDICTMCGKMYAVRNVSKVLRGEKVDIMD